MKQYEDLYKLEPGGHYILRADPNKMDMENKEFLKHTICLLLDYDIDIRLVFAKEGALEFIPKAKQNKEEVNGLYSK